ncbi:MAG TPA: TaqI-like C-terminal specificity domain-containing protein [bacterium]|nr:TaqI-like C-terminal specificity domain-containing protein [bacterium]
MKNSPDSSSRYDLPGSRILIRSWRACARRARALAGDSDPVRLSQVEARVLCMVRDLFVVRLLEDHRSLSDRWLCGGKRSRPLEGALAVEKLAELNGWAGFALFDLEAWQELGPGPELGELYREMQLSRFWPPQMPVECLGALWEEGLPGLRRNGVYYTPRHIVEFALKHALEGLWAERRPGVARVLDPACGAGYFLLEAFRRLSSRELSRYSIRGGDLFAPVKRGESGRPVLDPARRLELIGEHIFGVDIDGVALELARRALFVEAVADVPALRGAAPDPAPLFRNLREGDAIVEERFPQQASLFDSGQAPALKPFFWRDPENGFGHIMGEGGFSCIVGNPPWVSLKGRHKQVPYSQDVVQHLVERYHADTYRPNVVEFFIRRAIELLAENGWHSFVAPDRIAENEQYAPLRKFMLEHGELSRLHYREPFPGVAADTLVYVYCKRPRPRRSARIILSDASGAGSEVSQGFWLKGEVFVPQDARGGSAEDVLKKIEAAGRRSLSDFMETGVGFIAKPRRITGERTSENQLAVLKGEHVSPYARSGSAWFEFTLPNLAGGTRNLDKLTKKHRILLRKTGARLVAARDESGDIPEQSLYFAFLKDRRLSRKYQLAYFLGILNSRVMSFCFRHRKITNRATTPQIKKIHLDTLPIRPINWSDPAARELHDALVSAVLKREAAADPETIARLDREIDGVVAGLYDLDEREMEIIKAEMNKGWG